MPFALPRGPRYTRRPPRPPGPGLGRGGTEGPLWAPPPPRGDVTMPEPRSSWAGSAHPPVKAALIGRAAAGKAEPVGVAPLGGRGSGRSRRPALPSTGPERPGPAPPPARRARTHPPRRRIQGPPTEGRSAPAPGSDGRPKQPEPWSHAGSSRAGNSFAFPPLPPAASRPQPAVSQPSRLSWCVLPARR